MQQYYIDVIREGSSSPQDLYNFSVYGMSPNANPFGGLKLIDHGPNCKNMTLKQVAFAEWQIVERIMRKVLRPRGQAQPLIQAQAQAQQNNMTAAGAGAQQG